MGLGSMCKWVSDAADSGFLAWLMIAIGCVGFIIFIFVCAALEL